MAAPLHREGARPPQSSCVHCVVQQAFENWYRFASQCGPKSTEIGPDVAEFGPKLVGPGPGLVEVCRLRTTTGQIWSTLSIGGRIRPTSCQSWSFPVQVLVISAPVFVGVGRRRARFGRTRAKFGRFRADVLSMLVEFGPQLTESKPKLLEIGMIRPRVGRLRPEIGRSEGKLAHVGRPSMVLTSCMLH